MKLLALKNRLTNSVSFGTRHSVPEKNRGRSESADKNRYEVENASFL